MKFRDFIHFFSFVILLKHDLNYFRKKINSKAIPISYCTSHRNNVLISIGDDAHERLSKVPRVDVSKIVAIVVLVYLISVLY